MGKIPKLTRRQFMKALAGAGLFAALGGPGYSYGIERHWIETTEHRIAIFPGEQSHPFKGSRIVHITDIHYGHHWHQKQFASLAKRIESLKPDMICFTGDLIDSKLGDIAECAALFKQIEAPLGKYAVLGNHDKRYLIPDIHEFWLQAGFELIVNDHRIVRKDGASLVVAGIDDTLSGYPDLKGALRGIGEEETVLLLAHEPDFADTAAEFPQVKLQLSGHSHGGQIRLPFVGAIFTPHQGSKYVAGLYTIGNSGLHVYTSRGIGTTALPIRFLCRPELAVITLA
ncbi:hypothetical protein FHS18_006507 [Paenibacillus phyllosphaerae]|uniref:Calcineurin-like phosphoesterase domain-containing protein n=1 Tax=Paenibacillus phyllosphaerae TaxID=274593 RepID=A0A7W5FRC7_9BACL|nr:metallophosphoesterase [Paenibacillus phyllosphaerae]MBB3114386.1 hypothetical protein [Paenibacillus phyllosphaerae]